MATDEAGTIQLERIGRNRAFITVEGTAPLIMHRFDEKAKQQMLDGQMQKARVKKPPKDPEAEFQRAIWRLGQGYGFPSVGFKAATIGAARFFDKITMADLRRSLFFVGEGDEQLTKLETGEPKMREDLVRIARGGTDLRYRPQFDEWRAVLEIVYLPSMITLESLAALVDAGGMGGVGEWRPGKCDSGSYGTYQVIGESEERAPAKKTPPPAKKTPARKVSTRR
jgi:hypothetical protein